MNEYRVEFDAEVTFLNGGGLQVQGFRLDVNSPNPAEADVATAFIRHLGLLMVDQVRLAGLHVFPKAHKGSRHATASATRGVTTVADLSHPIEHGMITYPGLPGPQITPHLTREQSRASYAPGVQFAIDRISMVGNTGTYLDSPWHRYEDGADLAQVPLGTVVDLPGVVVHVADSSRQAVDVPALAPFEVQGCAVLLHTGWDVHWGTEQYGGPDSPYLGAEAARWLVMQGAALVGIDSVNIDNTQDPGRPAHSILLRAGIPIVEHLTGLAQLPAVGSRVDAAPLPIRGLGTAPVRAYARVPPGSD